MGPEDEDDLDDTGATDELAFADGEERLPWLESGDYDDEDQDVDTGRIVGFALVGLLVIAALVGGIWWFSRTAPDRELVADGSTIAAPEGPYKTRPADPGGKQFEGTGNVAPAVGEGQIREGHLATDPVPRPSVDARTTADSGEAEPEPAAAVGAAVQVGAYSTRESAEAGWRKLMNETDKLAGVSHRVVQGRADIGTVYRLQAMTGDAAAARALCNALKSDGVACQVK
jgi:hypothetical protein